MKSIVVEFSDLCTSRSGHAAGAKGPALDCIIWSVAASMHCWTTRFGALLLPILVLTCHNPGLRDGNSAAGAGTGIATIRTKIKVAPIDRTKFSCFWQPCRVATPNSARVVNI
jgi:hypothetical protein